jgi:LmbE family N-acetylglucosaminyl deacetylase
MKKGAVLGIFAHPDDESFGPGGTLVRCAHEGLDVHVCTVTDGAAGTTDPDCWKCLDGYSDLAQRRVEELACAVDILGGTLHFLGYRDSGMQGSESNFQPEALINQPLESVTGRLTELIRQLRPDVIVTHDETGGYSHPDHIYVHRAVVEAFRAAGDPTRFPEQLTGRLAVWSPQALYCHVIPRKYIRYLALILRLSGQNPARFGQNQDIDLTRIGQPADQIHVRVDVRKVLSLKQQASACHGSQGGGSGLGLNSGVSLRERLIVRLRRWFNTREHFQQLHPEPTGRRSGFLF